MEIRTLVGIPLEVYSDEILGVSYLKIITTETLESVKLPTSLKNYKHRHLLTPNTVITCEVIKTKKNWVISSVQKSFALCELNSYQDYLKFATVSQRVKKSLKYGQRSDILDFLVDFFKINSIASLDISHFENSLNKNLGFA